MSISKSQITSFIFLIIFIGYLSRFFIVSSIFYISLCALALFFLRSFCKGFPRDLVIYILALAAGIVFHLFNHSLHNGYFALINIPAQIGIAIGLSRLLQNQSSIVNEFSISLYRLIAFGFILWLISGFNPNEFLNSSKNHVFPLLLSILILSQLASRRARDRDISFSDLFLLLVVSVSTMSIASIAISVLIILFYPLRSATSMKILGAGILYGFIIYVAYANLEYIFETASGLDLSFANYDVDKLLRSVNEKIQGEDVRLSIARDYIYSVDLMSIVLGSNIEMWEWGFHGADLLYHTSVNLHNSYLLSLAKYGLIISGLLLGVLIKQIFYASIGRFSRFLYLALLLRGFTDTIIIAHGYLDWCLFMLFFSRYVFGSESIDRSSDSGRTKIAQPKSFRPSGQLLPKI